MNLKLPEPDSLEMNLDEQEINDLNSGKAVVEESTVMEMLDLVSSISTSQDVYLDIDKKAWNKYDFPEYVVPSYDDSVYMERIQVVHRPLRQPPAAAVEPHVGPVVCLFPHV